MASAYGERAPELHSSTLVSHEKVRITRGGDYKPKKVRSSLKRHTDGAERTEAAAAQSGARTRARGQDTTNNDSPAASSTSHVTSHQPADLQARGVCQEMRNEKCTSEDSEEEDCKLVPLL
ncbi:hypothetical protein EYF80_025861 [Liparis tanakae]|uniref:Uncharacterized protein n=1 Tax=Liparis tanakae TaxID=230148 RepID=A0A4Z2HDH4_9TELE|nr:hypothetical protein EYF80_025861 [Liparis tanakae]